MRRILAGLVTGTLILLSTLVSVATTAGAAHAAKPPWHGSYIQITKITPTTLSARIRCPLDPNPNGTQHFSVTITNPDGSHAGYSADVVQYCDMARHQVRIPLTFGAVVPGTRVDVFGTIAGDGGEVNVWYTGWRVQR